MADMVVSALAQEGVSRASSYISTKIDDKASTAQNMARLEMALCRLEFGLERAGKMLITCVSLLRLMKILKGAYTEGTDLLNKHKLRVLQGSVMMEGHDAVAGRAVSRRYPFLDWIGRAKSLPISSLLALMNEDYLSSASVQIFEWYADCADKFVADVESACPLGRGTFRYPYPFVRQLLEGNCLWHESTRGSQRMVFHMWPLPPLDDRGVEVDLWYEYQDLRNTESDFCVGLMLRLSESTDIVGTAINSTKLLASQLKLGIESAVVGELTRLHDLQDVSHLCVPPLHAYADRSYVKWSRPDPVCCTANGSRSLASSIVSPDSSIQFPEAVIDFYFRCSISAPKHTLRNANASSPPLQLDVLFVPHVPSCGTQLPELVLEYGDKEECKSGSMQEMEAIFGSNALDYLVFEPEAKDYAIFWFSAHGAASVTLSKSSNEKAGPKPTPAPRRGRSAAKRKR